MGVKHTGSDSPCYRHVRDTHHVLGRGSKGALRRRDFSNAFIARFHSKYTKAALSGCWLWQAAKYRRGYGMVCIGRTLDGKQHNSYAHRVAYVLAHGDIPIGLVVMHACDTPSCVNPAHLSLGTQGDNMRDASVKGRFNVPHLKGRALTDLQVAEIRGSRESSAELARRFGVSKPHISLIRRGLRRVA